MSSIVEQIEQESFYGKYQLFIDGKWRDAENGKTSLILIFAGVLQM